MVNDRGYAEDGKRGRKAWSIERRGKRRLKRTGERVTRKLMDALASIAHLDDMTRMRIRHLLWGLFAGNSPPPPLSPA